MSVLHSPPAKTNINTEQTENVIFDRDTELSNQNKVTLESLLEGVENEV